MTTTKRTSRRRNRKARYCQIKLGGSYYTPTVYALGGRLPNGRKFILTFCFWAMDWAATKAWPAPGTPRQVVSYI